MSSSVQVANGLTFTSPNEASQLTIGASARVGPSARLSDVIQARLPAISAPQWLHLAELAALLRAAGVSRHIGAGLVTVRFSP